MARFDPDFYERYRVAYPGALFLPLRPMTAHFRGEGIRIADLGAGTGLSASSFLSGFPNVASVQLVDPDPGMLERSDFSDRFSEVDVRRVCVRAEDFDPEGQVDVVLMGSSCHWMRIEEVLSRLERFLRPGGALCVFEYQLPKARGEGAPANLNEWIRRQFNQVWRAPGQVPRGTLDELLEPVRAHREFSEWPGIGISEVQELEPAHFHGVLLSQSRYLAAEAALLPKDIPPAREELLVRLREFWGDRSTLPFDYRFEARFFRRRFC